MIKVVAHIRRHLWLHDLVVYILPIVTIGLHGLALILWMGLAKAGFYIDCEDWNVLLSFTDRGPVCITQGPKISLAAFIFLFMASSIYLTVYIIQERTKKHSSVTTTGRSMARQKTLRAGDIGVRNAGNQKWNRA